MLPSTEQPFPQYFDSDGSPLDGGYVYIGLVNQNPETAPASVYWDSAGTQPAAQPIRTLNGYAVRAGTPALLFTPATYSVTVKNHRGVVIYYAQDSAEFSEKFFKATGAGAIDRSINDKLEDYITVEDFGATGVGTETADIQAALTAYPVVNVPFLDTYTTGPGIVSTNNVLNWPAGSYTSNSNMQDPVVLSNLSAAPALTFANESRHAFSRSFGNLKANDIYNAIYPNINSFDVGSNVLQVTSGSTIENVTATAGYFRNNTASPSNPVALFGCGLISVNNGFGWGLNTLLQDSDVRAVGAGTGRRLIGAELDFNIMNPGTDVIGVSVGGNSLSQPAIANAFIVNSLGNGNRWKTGFWTFDGSADTAMVVGSASVTGINVPSQIVQYVHNDNAGAKQVATFKIDPGGPTNPTTSYYTIGGSIAVSVVITSGDLLLSAGHALVVNGNPVVGSRIGGYGTPTNVSKLVNFPGTAATLAQTGGTLAALIADLKTHGLIGV